MAGDVIDDHVGHDLDIGRQCTHVIPTTQTFVHLRMVYGIEARIRAVDGMKEGQQVHATEQSGQRAREQLPQTAQRAAETICVADQLNLVLHPGELPSDAPSRRLREGSRNQLASNPASSSAENTVASTKPARGVCQASLTAPIANGPAAAASAVKNRITPAAAPC